VGKRLIRLESTFHCGRELGLTKVIRVRYENGVLKPLEHLELEEGEEVEVILKTGGSSLAQKLYGIAKKRRPELTKDEFLKVIEEIENEGIRGF